MSKVTFLYELQDNKGSRLAGYWKNVLVEHAPSNDTSFQDGDFVWQSNRTIIHNLNDDDYFVRTVEYTSENLIEFDDMFKKLGWQKKWLAQIPNNQVIRNNKAQLTKQEVGSRMARPTVMTPEVIDKLEYAFSLGCSDNEACLHAGIAVQTLYKYQEREPAFLERKLLLKDSPIFLARQTVLKGIQRDPDLALKFLERRKKDEFSTKTESDITSGGNALEPVLVKFIGLDKQADGTDTTNNWDTERV